MNAIIDLKNAVTFSQVSPPVAKTATFTAANDVDCRDYIGNIVIVQDVGTVTGTTPTLAGKIQDSDDDSSYTDVAGLTFTQATASNDLQTLNVDTRAVRRYIRYIGTIGGTTPSFSVGVLAIGQKQNQ